MQVTKNKTIIPPKKSSLSPWYLRMGISSQGWQYGAALSVLVSTVFPYALIFAAAFGVAGYFYKYYQEEAEALKQFFWRYLKYLVPKSWSTPKEVESNEFRKREGDLPFDAKVFFGSQSGILVAIIFSIVFQFSLTPLIFILGLSGLFFALMFPRFEYEETRGLDGKQQAEDEIGILDRQLFQESRDLSPFYFRFYFGIHAGLLLGYAASWLIFSAELYWVSAVAVALFTSLTMLSPYLFKMARWVYHQLKTSDETAPQQQPERRWYRESRWDIPWFLRIAMGAGAFSVLVPWMNGPLLALLITGGALLAWLSPFIFKGVKVILEKIENATETNLTINSRYSEALSKTLNMPWYMRVSIGMQCGSFLGAALALVFFPAFPVLTAAIIGLTIGAVLTWVTPMLTVVWESLTTSADEHYEKLESSESKSSYQQDGLPWYIVLFLGCFLGWMFYPPFGVLIGFGIGLIHLVIDTVMPHFSNPPSASDENFENPRTLLTEEINFSKGSATDLELVKVPHEYQQVGAPSNTSLGVRAECAL